MKFIEPRQGVYYDPFYNEIYLIHLYGRNWIIEFENGNWMGVLSISDEVIYLGEF